MPLATHYRTAKLVLRPVVAADEAAMVEGIDDLDVAQWLAVVPHPYTTADFRQFLAEIAVPGETFLIANGAVFVGIISLVDGVLGYWLHPGSQGAGYATEAGRRLVAAHFAASDAPLTSGYFHGNVRSANVLRKLGFEEVGRDVKHCRALGTDRPHVIVSLTRDRFL